MTKKAEKMLATYTDKMELHTNYFVNHSEEYKEAGKLDKEYEFVKDFVKDIRNDFTNMISGMYRFNMLSEKDFEELMKESSDLYISMKDTIFEKYFEIKH